MVQAPASARRPAAEAALQSIVHLCRWACEPLQGRHHTKQVAEEQGDFALELLCKAAGSRDSSNSGGIGRGGGSGGAGSLCAAGVAAAGSPQLQRSAAALADVLVAAAERQDTLEMAGQLAAVARLLLCMCGCLGPSSPNAHAPGSGIGSGSCPVTVACLHSRPGQWLLKTRVDTPAKLLRVVARWFDAERAVSLADLLQLEVRGRRFQS
jgi:hypothetical protein